MLAGRPEFYVQDLFSGQYFMDVENYFSDQFLNRENFIQASKELSKYKGISRKEEVLLVDFEGQNVGGNSEEESNSTAAEPAAKGNLLILDDTVMEIFKFNSDKSKLYADTLNAVQSMLGDNINVYSVLTPIQIEFLDNEKYKELSDSQFDAIEYVNSNLSENIKAVDVYSALQNHSDEYIYFRTDHHWTALGAYYGYTAFAEAAGFVPLQLTKYREERFPGFLGYISNINPSKKVDESPDDVIYYNPPVDSEMTVYYYDKTTGEKKSYEGAVINEYYLETNQKYGVFIGGDFPLGIIKTEAKTDKKAMIIKDSNGNAFVPFLVPHYSEIYIVDPRSCKENIINIVKDNKIDDVIFLNYILTTNFETFMDNILGLTK